MTYSDEPLIVIISVTCLMVGLVLGRTIGYHSGYKAGYSEATEAGIRQMRELSAHFQKLLRN